MTKDRTPDQPENPENTEINDAVEADVEPPADETTVLPTDDTAQFDASRAAKSPVTETSEHEAEDAVHDGTGRSAESEDPFWHPQTPETTTSASSPEWTSGAAIPAIPAAAAAAGAGGTAYRIR